MAASEPDDCAHFAALCCQLYIIVLAYDDILFRRTGSFGPDAAAVQTLPDGIVDKSLGKIQPAWRDRIANLRLNKPAQLMKLGECSTGPTPVAAADRVDAKTKCQAAAASDSTNAVVDGSKSSRH